MTDLEKIEAMKKANWTPGIEHWKRRAEAAETALKTARDNALEEAAKVADSHLDRVEPHHPDQQMEDLVSQGYGNAAINIAHSIRAMKEKSHD